MPRRPHRTSARAVFGGIVAGLFFCLLGGFIMAAASGLLGPPPPQPAAPAWVAIVAGAAFFVVGVLFVLGAFARDDGDLPPNVSPARRRAIDWLSAGLFALFAIPSTWIAIFSADGAIRIIHGVSGLTVDGLVGRGIAASIAALCWWSFFHSLYAMRKR